MDYAERGALEKTFDELLTDDSWVLDTVDDTSEAALLDGSGQLSAAGELYAQGVLTGMLATIRTFLDDSSSLTAEDAEEISRIVRRREQEIVSHLAESEVQA